MTQRVEEIAEATNNPRVWRALVYARYNGDSEYGKWIATHRQCLPYLLEQAHSRYSVRRMTSVYVIASMLAKAKAGSHPFPPAEYEARKRTIRHLASNDDVAVASSAAEGLGLTHDPEDAEFVEHLSARFAEAFLRKETLEIAKQIRDANSSQPNQPNPSDGAGPKN